MIRAGKLDRTITILRASTVLDDAGTPAIGWLILATLRGELINDVVDESQQQIGAVSDRMIAFRTRYRAGISLSDRLEYQREEYNIKQVRELGRRRGLEIRAEKVA